VNNGKVYTGQKQFNPKSCKPLKAFIYRCSSACSAVQMPFLASYAAQFKWLKAPPLTPTLKTERYSDSRKKGAASATPFRIKIWVIRDYACLLMRRLPNTAIPSMPSPRSIIVPGSGTTFPTAMLSASKAY